MNKKERKEYLSSLPSRTMTDKEWRKHALKESSELDELEERTAKLDPSTLDESVEVDAAAVALEISENL